MEEKVLIKSDRYENFAPIMLTISIVSLIIGIVFMSNYHTTSSYYSPYYGSYMTASHYDSDMMIGGIIFFSISLISFLLFLIPLGSQIVVSNLRVSGRAMFGKQVDIPIDSISAVGKMTMWRGISVASSSGMIRFFLFKNADEIFAVVSELLQKRQIPKQTETIISYTSTSDELVKYKELLDAGIITQEEFEAKKKQILGL